jgi:hypothetical protein
MPFACRVLGHRVDFWSEGETMHWRCARECGFEGEKRYSSAADARRYTTAFSRDAMAGSERRAPLSLLPLRLIRRRSRTKRSSTGAEG